jgi:hypothetical protein
MGPVPEWLRQFIVLDLDLDLVLILVLAFVLNLLVLVLVRRLVHVGQRRCL